MEQQVSGFAVKKGLAQMLKGGVIMDVVTPEHARIAEDAGAVAVMALERVPADIRASGGVARMSDPELILRIMETVSIPVSRNAHQFQFLATPPSRTNPVTRLGVSAEKVVATIETPSSHQGIFRPERKNS